MNAITAPQIDFNADLDYERAVEALKRRAGTLYHQYQAAKANAALTEDQRSELLSDYGLAIEASKTLRPNDTGAIRAILADPV